MGMSTLVTRPALHQARLGGHGREEVRGGGCDRVRDRAAAKGSVQQLRRQRANAAPCGSGGGGR